jgi:hypothetical protein
MTGNRISLLEFLVLAGVVTALTVTAAVVYPIWDDGRLILYLRQFGPASIQTGFGDRPLVSLLFVFLADHQLFLPVGLVFHWITWLGMGLVTIRLWRMMFPALSGFALLPALIAVAPILCKVQFVIVTVAFIVTLGPLLVFVAILLLLSEAASPRRKIVVYAVSLFLISFSILISEYAVPTAAAGFVLLTAKAMREEGKHKRESRVIAILVAVCALSSYLLFSFLHRSTVSDSYRPGFALQSLSWKMRMVPFRLLSAIWRGAIGAFLEALGSLTMLTKAALLSFLCGAVVSCLVTWGIYKRRDTGTTSNEDQFSAITLLVATAVAILPVLLMDRTLETKWDSRFWLPILPIISSLTVFILLSLVRKRFWLLVPIVCGFLAGYATTAEITNAFRHPESLDPMPRQVEPYSRQSFRQTGGYARCSFDVIEGWA